MNMNVNVNTNMYKMMYSNSSNMKQGCCNKGASGVVTPILCIACKTVVLTFTLTRIINSVVTGQAAVILELRDTPGKKHKPKVVRAYITADAIHASTRNM